MNTISPDQLFEDFFVELKDNPSDGWIARKFSELCDNGFSKEGILQAIKEDLGDEVLEKTNNAIGNYIEDSSGSIHKKEEELVGVGGWLVLFCLVILVFSPARAAFSLYGFYTSVVSSLYTNTSVQYIFAAVVLPTVALMLFSMYCGIQLWMVKKGAVEVTKIFLITYMVVNTLSLFIVFSGGFTPESFNILTSKLLFPYVQSCIFFGVWFSYLNMSKRVKNTYVTT